MIKLLQLFIPLLFVITCLGQDQHVIDSLETELKNHNARKLELGENVPDIFDSTAAQIITNLSSAFLNNNPGKALEYANQVLALSESIGFKKGISNAYSMIGYIAADKGDNLSALEFHKKALKIREEIGYPKGIAGSYNNIGSIYQSQGNYPEALKNFFAALKINDQIGSKPVQASTLARISDSYFTQANLPEAIRYCLNALRIYEELGDKWGLIWAHNHLGNIYSYQGKYEEALKNSEASLKLSEETGNKMGIADCYNAMGIINTNKHNYSEALKQMFDALKIQEELGSKYGIGLSASWIAEIYFREKKYEQSAEYYSKAMTIAKELGNFDLMSQTYKDLSRLDSARGNFKQSFENYKLYISLRDSVHNAENTKKLMQQQMQYDFDKKESLTKAENEKELQKQKFVRNGFMGGSVLFLLLAGAIFIGLRKTGKAKKKSEELLLNILPAEVAEEIKSTGTAKAKSFTMVTVMFTDFKDFTSVSEKVSAELLVDEIHTCFSAFDHILQKHKIEKIKTIGDAYLCASGLPVSNYTHAVDMLNASFEIRDYMLQRKKEKESRSEIPFEIRIGIHTGPVVAGIVGVKKYAYDIWGDTVNLAARMEQNSEAGKINISGSTYELVKTLPAGQAGKFTCIHRGKIDAKNKGLIDMYFAEKIS